MQKYDKMLARSSITFPEGVDLTMQNFQVLIASPNNISQLLQLAETGNLERTKVRWNAWQLLLNIIDNSSIETIASSIVSSRASYHEKAKKFIKNNDENNDPLLNNPLVKSKNNNVEMQDIELKKMLIQDIERTYSGHEFFLQENIRQLMLNILFVWSKLNPISYRQGMNEILAAIMYTRFTAQIPSDQIDAHSHSDLYKLLNDPKEIEGDIFNVYSKLMEKQQEFFLNNGDFIKKVPGKKNDPFSWDQRFNDASNKNLPIVARSLLVYEKILARNDDELYSHLEHLKMQPQFFLLRWIRCLFTREFHLENALIFFDAIFACFKRQENYDLINYICVAMIKFVRAFLLQKNDVDVCLKRLMKYPPVENMTDLLELAYKEKKNYEATSNISGGENFQKSGGYPQKSPSIDESLLISGFEPHPFVPINLGDKPIQPKQNAMLSSENSIDNPLATSKTRGRTGESLKKAVESNQKPNDFPQIENRYASKQVLEKRVQKLNQAITLIETQNFSSNSDKLTEALSLIKIIRNEINAEKEAIPNQFLIVIEKFDSA